MSKKKLFRRLGYAGAPPQGVSTEGLSGAVAADVLAAGSVDEDEEPPPLDELELEVLAERLREEPDVMLQRAQAVWDSQLTEDELREAISRAQGMLRAPDEAIRWLDASDTYADAAAPELPPEFYQDDLAGWDPNDPMLKIDTGSRKFETKGDLVNWVLLGGLPVLGAKLAKKAPFRWHGRHASGFVYSCPPPAPAKPVRVGMVSDFGTGLYHSNYIAKTLQKNAYPYVIHGGDVYYSGRSSEFGTNFRPQLDPLVKAGTQVLTLNANHEMYSSGKPYFRYISDRKASSPQQLQEGSYFCLRFASLFQVIGIDTAYFRNARFNEPELLVWLERVLLQGRQAGAINILFSSNEPYDYGSTKTTPLLDDVRKLVDAQLIDLWFWGNTHHCALYDRAPELPFIGSCIGHGGYPFDRVRAGRPSAATVRFLETNARFPAYTNVRQDRGNNGFCEMTLLDNQSVQLKYIDWMRKDRCRAVLSRKSGRFEIDELEL